MKSLQRMRKTYIASLHKVPSNKQIPLVRRNFDVVRSNNRLVFVGIIETNRIIQVRDIDCCNVVSKGKGEISEFTIVADIRVDGY